jgi:hypothetical protein
MDDREEERIMSFPVPRPRLADTVPYDLAIVLVDPDGIWSELTFQ